MGPDEGETNPACAGRETFEAVLFRVKGDGGWVFAAVPEEHAPDRAGPFGRVPVASPCPSGSTRLASN
ncbi:DUF1905 domain-containing protein [Polymorphospora rubra]|uniref:DUF1905 domain-containing protein n=1 Tax=Polymorphospora rubra TaxID=338584 RepID=UPI00340E75C8